MGGAEDGEVNMCTYKAGTVCVEIFGTFVDQSYLNYVLTYFGSIMGGILFLIGYNMFKMFGWDEDLNAINRSVLEWFINPPTRAEKEAMDAKREGKENEEDTNPFNKN